MAGVLARAHKSHGVILVYLFGRRLTAPPPLEELAAFRPERAVSAIRIGDLHIIDGKWPLLGKTGNWDRREWGMPAFQRRDPLSGKTHIVTYDENDPRRIVSLRRVATPDTGLETDSVWGAGAVERHIPKWLSVS